MNAEELHTFNEHLKSFRNAFGKPLTEQKTLVQNGIRQYKQAVATHEEQKQELLKLEKKYQGTAEQIRREMDKENMAIENLQRSVDKLREKQRGLPEKLDTYKRETRHEEDLLEAKRAKMEEIERSRKEKVQQLLGAIALYKERLGLSFESIGDARMRFTFTLIDHNQPEREFWFLMRLDANDVCKIEDTQPPVEVTDLEAKYNKSNNLPVLLREMRQRFAERV